MIEGRHIIPFFIPHLGCPHQCVFCNQHHVSGQVSYPGVEDIERAIDNWNGQGLPEIAFYGGSFTGLSPEKQRFFLAPAYRAVKENKIRAIRVSTRPDYINKEILLLLSSYGVTTVELGVQSLDEEVLSFSGRGHSVDDTFCAISLLKEHGFKVGVQLMPGLPGDSAQKSIEGAFTIAKLRPDMVRIYPTVVLKDTLLHKLFIEGLYQPLSLQESVAICKDMLATFRYFDINVIRVGLQPTKDISEGAQVVAGPFHPAFGELVESALIKKHIERVLEIISNFSDLLNLILFVSPKDCSIVAGHKKENILDIKQKFNINHVKILALSELPRGTIGVSRGNEDKPELIITRKDFLQHYMTQQLIKTRG